MPTFVETVQLTATRVVAAGEIFDGGNRRYNLSGGSQSEGQPPVFRVENGVMEVLDLITREQLLTTLKRLRAQR